jgi:hypothetical protein
VSDATAPGSDPRPTVYVETSVISYLASQPSSDLIVRGHQKSTTELWARRGEIVAYVSPLVKVEAAEGDPLMVAKRLSLLAQLPMLDVPPAADRLAAALLRSGPLPRKAENDAVHIAVAAVGGMEYLITWNLKHIANPAMRRRIEEICRANGVEPPILCTPEELKESL